MPTPVHRSLGSRLEEARRRKGVSLREAGEATKIRTEYLARFEEGDFDIPLPGIYQRGFAKLYANFLGEDGEEVAAEVRSLLQQGRSAGAAPGEEPRVSLGQLDLGNRRNKERTAAQRRRSRSLPPAPGPEGGEADAAAEEEEAPAGGRGRLRLPQWTRGRERPAAADWEEEEEWERSPGPDRGFYLKVVAIIGSVTVAIILLFALVKAFTGAPAETGGTETAVVAGREGPAETATETPGAAAGAGATLTLRATDGATWVRVNDAASDEVLLRTSLEPGATESVDVNGEALILFTQGENLEVERGGEIFAPSRSGPGKIRIE